MSQLNLAAEAQTTPRHVSFIETGRSVPTREMIDRLATALDIPLRERNALMLAAGYAPTHSEWSLDDEPMEPVSRALRSMLAAHLPYPAVVMDRRWNVLETNEGANRLFGMIMRPDLLPAEPNVLDLMLNPGRVRDAVSNWPYVAVSLLRRIRTEALGGVVDEETADLVAKMESTHTLPSSGVDPAGSPVIDVVFEVDEIRLSFFSVISTIGTAVDVTAQELRLEAFFPSDEETIVTWENLSSG